MGKYIKNYKVEGEQCSKRYNGGGETDGQEEMDMCVQRSSNLKKHQRLGVGCRDSQKEKAPRKI